MEALEESVPARRRAPPAAGVFVAGTLLPVALLSLGLKVLRLRAAVVPGENLPWRLLVPETAWQLALAAVAAALLAGVQSGWGRRWARRTIRIAAGFHAAIAVAAHLCLVKTGAPLEVSLLGIVLRNFAGLRGLLAAEFEWRWLWLLAVTLVASALGPRLCARLRPAGPLPSPPPRGRRRFLGVAAGLGLAALALAAAGRPQPAPRGIFAAEPVLHLLGRSLRPPDLGPGGVGAEAGPPPRHTRLAATARSERRNLVFVILESTRASATTPFAPHLATTPVLAALASQSRLHAATAVVPHTSKALVAILCGIEPPLDAVNSEAGEPNPLPARCLPHLLADIGYRSVFLQSATETFERRRALVDHLGFHEFRGLEDVLAQAGVAGTPFERVNYFAYEDDILLAPVRHWLEQRGEEPWMLTVLTGTGHHDYGVPSNFPRQRWTGEARLDRYLDAVHYQDRFLGRLLGTLRALGRLEDSLVVVVGDHGEGFGEHGRFQHDAVIYEEGLRVPLLLYDRRQPRGLRSSGPASLLDLLPTVIETLGYEIRGGRYRGDSLLGEADPQRPLYSACLVRGRCVARRKGQRKFIFHFGQQPDEFFDLARDPGEQRDLAATLSEEEHLRLREATLRWHREVDALYGRD